MNICLTHYRVGETDGVSLEMDKWKEVLENHGHKVLYMAGDTGPLQAEVIPELSLRNKEMLKIANNSFFTLEDYANQEELEKAVEAQAAVIEEKVTAFIERENIEILVPNNILCLGKHLAGAIALSRVIKKKNLKVVCHHHDFYWERDEFLRPTCQYVIDVLDNYFPPVGDNIQHCVINNPAKADVKEKKGVESTVVPNVFDFKQPLWVEDDYNSDFRETLGIKEDDLFFLQATRVTDRKAIELAIDLVAKLQEKEYFDVLTSTTLYNGKKLNKNSKIHLALVGMSEGTPEYDNRLIKHAKDMNVNLIWCNELIKHSREVVNDKKYYSLWDAYVQSDIVTYPSIYEGWGNQLLETMFAKKPVVVFEYSVFVSDIKSNNLEYANLGSKYTINEEKIATVTEDKLIQAADETMKYLLDNRYRNEAVEKNFKIGNDYYSMEALDRILGTKFGW